MNIDGIVLSKEVLEWAKEKAEFLRDSHDYAYKRLFAEGEHKLGIDCVKKKWRYMKLATLIHLRLVLLPITIEDRLIIDDLKQDVEPPDNGQET